MNSASDLSPHSTREVSAVGLHPSRTALALTLLVAALAAIAAGAGLFLGGGEPATFTSIFGDTVTLYGRGLYRNDSLMVGSGYLGQDAVVLFLGIPLLLVSAALYRRGSLRGGLLLFGTLGYFLYVYVSMALGATYNPFFLLYIALFSASFFAFALLLVSLRPLALGPGLSPGLPFRAAGWYMLVAGLLTLFVWGLPLVTALIQGNPPDIIQSYTTIVTFALDLAVITPMCFVTGRLLWRREPLGVVFSFPLLVLIVLLLPTIALMTVSQIAAGVQFTPPEIAGPIVGFALLGVPGLWMLGALLRGATADRPFSTSEVPTTYEVPPTS
jgi:hypothetical protein